MALDPMQRLTKGGQSSISRIVEQQTAKKRIGYGRNSGLRVMKNQGWTPQFGDVLWSIM